MQADLGIPCSHMPEGTFSHDKALFMCEYQGPRLAIISAWYFYSMSVAVANKWVSGQQRPRSGSRVHMLIWPFAVRSSFHLAAHIDFSISSFNQLYTEWNPPHYILEYMSSNFNFRYLSYII